MASDDPIPAGVRRLLEQRFRSVSQVEAFVLLVREDRSVSADDAAHALGLGVKHVIDLLDELVDEKLLRTVDGRYQVAELTAARRRTVDELAQLYSRFRLRIMDIVLAVPRDQA
ncbi:MAG TPA: hypothetical protein VFU93_09775, partial [Acidimicrobiales bacterium]|nr:hypothetical protein [Acidimicrobiales bacterium]